MKLKTQLSQWLYGFASLLLILLIIQIASLSVQNKKRAAAIGNLPDFTFYQLNDAPFTRDSLTQGQALCLIYMDPGCEYCKKEIEDIIQHIDKFGHTNLVLISMTDIPLLKDYLNKHKMENPNGRIRILHDRNMQFFDLFGHAVTPTTYLYDKEHQLIKVFRGYTRTEILLKHL